MNYIVFPLIAAMLWAGCNIVDKISLSKLIKNPMTTIIMIGFFGLIAGILVVLFHGLVKFSAHDLLLAAVAGIGYTFMNVFYVKALVLEEASKVVPLFALGTVFIAVIAGLFINETFSLVTYGGIALVVLGAFTLSTTKLSNLDFHKGFWLMIAAALSIAITEVSQKYLLRTHDYWSVYAYSRFFSSLVILPVFFLHKDEFISLVRNKRYKTLGFMGASEMMNLVAILLVTIGSSVGYVTLVAAITETQHLFLLFGATLISLFFPKILQEKQSWQLFRRKLFSILSLLAGVILVTLNP